MVREACRVSVRQAVPFGIVVTRRPLDFESSPKLLHAHRELHKDRAEGELSGEEGVENEPVAQVVGEGWQEECLVPLLAALYHRSEEHERQKDVHRLQRSNKAEDLVLPA